MHILFKRVNKAKNSKITEEAFFQRDMSHVELNRVPSECIPQYMHLWCLIHKPCSTCIKIRAYCNKSRSTSVSFTSLQRTSLLSKLFGGLLLLMIIYFVISIVHSMAQTFAKRRDEEEIQTLLKSKKTK